MIDPHVHLRDWGQSEKETLAHAFAAARRAGLRGVFEMPNTLPTLTDRERIVQRIADADAVLPGEFFHGIYGGVTYDAAQLRDLACLAKGLFPRVVGLKMYAGHSTGQMGILEEDAQRMVYRTLAEEDYRGVLALHCEQESYIDHSPWNPELPHAHALMRPPEAEIVSLETQLRFAEEEGFQGSLHVCHVSLPGSLDIITRARQRVPFALRCGVTPHHALLSTDEREEFPGALSVNPPLREKVQVETLYRALVEGRADWIESDHAPHCVEEKRAGAAGLPGFAGYGLLLSSLRHSGLSGDALYALTEGNIIEAFALEDYLSPAQESAARELSSQELSDLAAEYPWNPYRTILTRR